MWNLNLDIELSISYSILLRQYFVMNELSKIINITLNKHYLTPPTSAAMQRDLCVEVT